MSIERTDAELLAEATETLRSHDVRIPGGARARIGAALEAKRQQRRWAWRPLAIAAGAVVAASLVTWFVLPAVQKQTPPPVRSVEPRPIVAQRTALHDRSSGETRLAPSARLSVGRRGTLVARQRSVLRIADGNEAITLNSGALDVEIAAGRRFTVRTPHARLRGQGARLHVAVRVAGTAISVTRGEVKVFSLDLTRASTLVAGQETFIESTSARRAGAVTNPRLNGARAKTPTTPPIAARRQRKKEALSSAASGSEEPGLSTTKHRRAAAPSLPRRVVETAPVPVPAPAPAPTSVAPPAPRAPVLGLLRRADQLRRSGRFAQAAKLYLAAANHPAGGPYVEEALLRRAILQAKRLGDQVAALQTLQAARRRLPSTSALLPERVALTAQILLDMGAPARAASVLQRCSSRSLLLLRLRLKAAKHLRRSNPRQARALLQPLVDAATPQTLRRPALQLLRQLRNTPGKTSKKN